MIMRYHWSLGIGHTYAHGTPGTLQAEHELSIGIDEEEGGIDVDPLLEIDSGTGPDNKADIAAEPDPDDPELALEERENEDLGIDDQYDAERLRHGGDLGDDELFEMYYM